MNLQVHQWWGGYTLCPAEYVCTHFGFEVNVASTGKEKMKEKKNVIGILVAWTRFTDDKTP